MSAAPPSSASTRAGPGLDWPDVALAALLFAATLFHLTRFPIHLPIGSDEAKQLYEAKRVFEGERMYRDVFDLIMPGWLYLMAFVYRLFGTTLLAARAAAGAIHGVTAALVFVACRRLGMRPVIGCAAALAYVVVCEPAFAVSSAHWLATSLSVLLLVVLLGRAPSTRRAFAAGIVVGLLAGVQQQRGALWGIGCAILFVGEATLAARAGAPFLSTASRRLLALAAGAALVVVPFVAWLVAGAGFDLFWTAVVVYPLVNYRAVVRIPWGAGGGSTHTLPWLVAMLPLVGALPAVRFLAQPLLRAAPEATRALLVLTICCACSVLSIAYSPDVAHLSFALPIFFVALAESREWGLRLLPARAGAALAWGISLSVLVAGGLRLERNLALERAERTVRWQSAFGPVDVSSSGIAFLEKLDALLKDAPSRSLYVHPDGRYIYLLTGARNPTRFQFILIGYHGEREVREVVDDLAANPPPTSSRSPGTCAPAIRSRVSSSSDTRPSTRDGARA